MAIEFERLVLPEYADVKIEVSVSARINITNVAALRKVSRLLQPPLAQEDTAR